MSTIYDSSDCMIVAGDVPIDGAGSGIGAKNNQYGAGATKLWWSTHTVEDLFNSNGTVLIYASPASFDQGSSRLTKAGTFTKAEIGMMAEFLRNIGNISLERN